jgi:diguanylate cyclase (GGDEF)-like protein
MDDIVELHLRASAPTLTDSSTWKTVVLQLLRLISDAGRDGESKDTAALRARLSQHREVLGQVLHPQEERQEGAECVTTCEEFLRRVHLDARARETELTDLVTLLRDATAKMIGESSDFHAEILSSADRFKTMAGLEDLRDLKRQLSDEISSLERAVETKKLRDREAMANLSKRVEVLQLDLGLAEERAALDPLTKLANRGGFDRALDRMMKSARASRTPLSLAMLDIDHFKKVNDTFGHQVGDRVLLCMADWLRGSIRQDDVVARYGGEEFAVILGIDLRQAEERFTKVLESVAGRSYDYEENGTTKSIRFTVSCGLTQLTDGDSAEDFIGRADQALYDAKNKGRNRVCVKKVSRLARLLGG